jgi:two-component system, cell cycle sensor histidine kinase and response regulator CckA
MPFSSSENRQKLFRILLVEDNPLDARLVLRLLQAASPKNDCQQRTTLAEAIETLSRLAVDVVLLDLNLDDSSGYETFARVRTAAPSAAILVLSASEDEELAIRTVREGAQDYLVKGSFDAKLLVRAILYAHERKLSEEALRTSQATARAMFENALDAIIIFEEHGKVREANEAAAALLGLSRGELTRKHLCDFGGEGLQAEIERMRTSQSGRGRFWIKRPDGEQRLVDYCFAANILPGRHLGTMRDITEQQNLEEQLRQSQKLEAVGRLAGSVAHDFNNILGVISGYAELIEIHAPDESTCNKAGKILSATTKASSLTKQLLAFGRKQVSAPRLINLANVISELSSMISCLVGADTQVVILSRKSLGLVYADHGQMEQALLNLITNAHESMPYGGTITIALDRLERSTGNEQVPPGNYIRLSVSDTGAGIDPEARNHIFEPFFTTKKTGSGLGLATVAGIVKDAGGHITVDSAPGNGSTFSIYLPVAAEAQETVSRPRRPMRSDLPGHETILFVDDEVELSDAATEYLEDRGYTILKASNAGSAMTMAKSSSQRISLLIADLAVAGGGGKRLAGEIREFHPQIEVLLISGYGEDELELDGFPDPVSFLQKPFTLQQLGEKIRTMLDAKSRV